jgi:hypothetical protein
MPEMRRVTIRFSASLWSLIEEEAQQEGVSAAQFVRDGTLTRVLWERVRRGVDLDEAVRQAANALREQEETDLRQVELAVEQVLVYAAPELNGILRKLDGVTPERADYIRALYGLQPGSFADERALDG